MKILDIQSALLSDAEVLSHIQSIQSQESENPDFTSTKTVRRVDGTSYQKFDGKLRELAVVVGDVIQHFSHTDSALSAQAQAGTQEPRAITEANAGETGEARHKSSKANADAVEAGERDARAEGSGSAKTRELLKRLSGLGLTKAELLMITNHRPRNEVVLDVLVEEMEGRLSAEQQMEVVRAVRDVYGEG